LYPLAGIQRMAPLCAPVGYLRGSSICVKAEKQMGAGHPSFRLMRVAGPAAAYIRLFASHSLTATRFRGTTAQPLGGALDSLPASGYNKVRRTSNLRLVRYTAMNGFGAWIKMKEARIG
jgi:hypothetical protein